MLAVEKKSLQRFVYIAEKTYFCTVGSGMWLPTNRLTILTITIKQ